MPVDPNASVRISAFNWVPPFAQGQVRDLRPRWALEEAGIPYAVRKLDATAERPADYYEEQPFGQVPSYRDDTVSLFESGGIVLHIGRDCEILLPADPAARARATAWLIAALNSVEPYLMQLATIDIFAAGEEWAKLRRPGVIEMIDKRLSRLSDALGDKDYLDGDRFTVGDLMMTTVLRIIDGKGYSTGIRTLSPTRCGARHDRHSRRRSPRRSPISKSADRHRPEPERNPRRNDMTYIDGFVAPVPQENKQAYLDHVREALSLFKDHGATRMVENWGDDVPVGKVTDFHRAVQARDGEAVLFGWIEWPSKDVRDAGMKAMEQDERMKTLVMPFDGQRMIYGGFSSVVEEGSADVTGYVDGIAAPVPLANRVALINMASRTARLFREYGALRVVEGWGDDVPDGKITDFRRAVEAREGETIIFSWIEWPSKQVRDEAWPKLRTDPRMQPDKDKMPFDGQRMMYGGFATLLDA